MEEINGGKHFLTKKQSLIRNKNYIFATYFEEKRDLHLIINIIH